ncbi:MAG TPA: RnfH family protein [Steroidobacteraceae bacterium]|nr:RnfH family protein [Steroidobacteraceae bacterium]
MKTCLLVVDAPGGVWMQRLQAHAGASIAELLQQAQGMCPAAGVDWSGAAVGVHGRRCDRSHVPADGERVEVYRELRADPRERRRQRVNSRRRAPASNAR